MNKTASLALCLTALLACDPALPPAASATVPLDPPRPAPTASATARPRESPPPPAPPVAFHLPPARWSTLKNHLALGVVTARGLPIVEARILVRGGHAAEGNKPGAAEILGDIIKGDVDVASLGASFSVEVSDDIFELRLAVTSDALAPALATVGAALRSPRLTAAAVARHRKRLVASAADRLSEDGESVAEQALRRLLLSPEHPYARSYPLPEELSRITPADVKALHARAFTGPSTTVILAGDVDPDAARAAVEKALSGLSPRAAATPALPPVKPPSPGRVVIVHRPGAERSEIYLGVLGPRPTDPAFGEMELILSLLGQKGTGRLFTNVRERDSLAYQIGAERLTLEQAPSLAVAEASTQAPKTGRAVAAMLAEITRLTREPPAPAEIDAARSVLRGALAQRLSRVGDIAGEIGRLRRFGLGMDAQERRDEALARMTPEDVRAAAARLFGEGRVFIVVAGDAGVVQKDLSPLGRVEVIDPRKGFQPR